MHQSFFKKKIETSLVSLNWLTEPIKLNMLLILQYSQNSTHYSFNRTNKEDISTNRKVCTNESIEEPGIAQSVYISVEGIISSLAFSDVVY